MRVYIAAPLVAAGLANTAADVLSPEFAIVSRWHRDCERYGLTADFDNPYDRFQCLSQNLIDLELTDAVVALTDTGVPRATFCEIGWALARGKNVVWVHGEHDEGRNVFDVHGLVKRVRAGHGTTLPRVAAQLRRLAAKAAA